MENKPYLIAYPRCSTCKRAENFLKSQSIDFEYRNIKEEALTLEELKEIYQKSKLPLKKFFNTSGMKYRELGLASKIKDMSEKEMLELLASDGMLVKRPIYFDGSQVILGFREADWQKI